MKHPLLLLSLILNLLLLSCLGYITYKMGYLGRFLIAATGDQFATPTDTLSAQPMWQETVRFQQMIADHHHFKACLFGDSISAQIENTLGNDTYNFAIPGMSTLSLLEQLDALKAVQPTCDLAILAIGTNDAAYRTNEAQFERNLKQIIAILRSSMGTQQIVLLPVFYSTVAASHDPSIAGTLERVEAINARLEQVASKEHLPLQKDATQALFAGQALRADLTVDGVHLNLLGRQIYRTALLRLVHTHEPLHE
ncbi:SGNH/GDSL hydrolase family protein [Stenomitos frigidus]|nr:GDSL-type esterase/lipase family protein [Stenomitos frigidus]